MMRPARSVLVCGLGAALIVSTAGAQNRVSGTLVTGGGRSTSPGFALTGAASPGPLGNSSSANFQLAANVVNRGRVRILTFVGSAVETVPIAPRTVRVVASGFLNPTGTFFYRMGGTTSYVTNALAQGQGDTLSFNVTANLLTIRGLEYYLEVQDGVAMASVGTSTNPLAFQVQLDNAQGQSPEALPDAQFRIVGLPLDIDSNARSVASVVVDDLGREDRSRWRLGSFDTATEVVQEFPNTAPVTPGRGYWLIARGNRRFGSAGRSVLPDRTVGTERYREVPLGAGFNQVANPFAFSVNWTEVLFDDNGNVVGHLTDVLDDVAFRYTGTQYISVQEIAAWEGVFVFIKKPGVKALFPYRERLIRKDDALSTKGEEPAGGWSVELKLHSGEFLDDGNLIGVHPGAIDGEDDLDRPEPPPPPGAPSLALRLPGPGGARLKRSDMRAPFADGGVWQLVMSQAGWNESPRPAAGRRLTVHGLSGLPEGMAARFFLDTGVDFPLSDQSVVDLPAGVGGGRIVIGTPEFVRNVRESGPLPPIRLFQNTPNPFLTSTSIGFELPRLERVQLGVFDLSGRKVRTLLDGIESQGSHTATWDGLDDEGRRVAGGMYFYRLSAGPHREVKTMLKLGR